MRLHYTRVVCERNSRRQFRLNLILRRFRFRTGAAQWNRRGLGRPLPSPQRANSAGLRLPTIILKGRPFSEIYGFTWNFRLKFTVSVYRCHSNFRLADRLRADSFVLLSATARGALAVVILFQLIWWYFFFFPRWSSRTEGYDQLKIFLSLLTRKKIDYLSAFNLFHEIIILLTIIAMILS